MRLNKQLIDKLYRQVVLKMHYFFKVCFDGDLDAPPDAINCEKGGKSVTIVRFII